MGLGLGTPADAVGVGLKARRRLAVTLGSFCLSEPAAQLRGLTKGSRPARFSSSLTCSKPLKLMYTSPRISRRSGGSPDRRRGIAAMARAFAVTSSPVSPSPRVAARTKAPFS